MLHSQSHVYKHLKSITNCRDNETKVTLKLLTALIQNTEYIFGLHIQWIYLISKKSYKLIIDDAIFDAVFLWLSNNVTEVTITNTYE